jgi:serine protease Do
MSLGIVSGLGRSLRSQRGSFLGGSSYSLPQVIQTDAPINPGNSGGPLVNIRAEVIGVNQAIFTSGFVQGNIGVGFAIPIDGNTKQIVESLKGGEPIVRGQLGVTVAELTPTLKSVFEAENGVFVQEVLPNTPAERGGMKNDDVVVDVDGEKVTSVDQFVNMIQMTKPGTTITMGIVRDGEPTEVEVTIEALSLDVAKAERAEAETTRLGLTVETVPAGVAEEAGVSGGVLVSRVKPLSDAARAGIRRGDIILKINRKPVADVKGYKRIVKDLEAGDPVAIRVWREDRTLTAQIDRLSE